MDQIMMRVSNVEGRIGKTAYAKLLFESFPLKQEDGDSFFELIESGQYSEEDVYGIAELFSIICGPDDVLAISAYDESNELVLFHAKQNELYIANNDQELLEDIVFPLLLSPKGLENSVEDFMRPMLKKVAEIKERISTPKNRNSGAFDFNELWKKQKEIPTEVLLKEWRESRNKRRGETK